MASNPSDHVTIISADCHGGASKQDYRPYLDSAWHGEFDEWAAAYKNPFVDLDSEEKNRNYDNDRRTREQHQDGVVAEVVFPNTAPPFFPTGQLIAPPPRARDFEKRRAGLRAHNRWLADFCADLPGQRVGLPQVMLNDVEEAIADVKLSAEAGFKSMLVPHIPPDSDLSPYFTADYDQLWAAFVEHDMIVTMHGGSGTPRYLGAPSTPFLMLMEVPFYAQKSLWHMILSGVFDRFPDLRLVLTEQGVQWIPPLIERMDHFWHQFTGSGNAGELNMGADATTKLPPSEYIRRNCWFGASFPAPPDARAIREIGIDRVMWGSDYPHKEGTYPLSRESLRYTFAGWTDTERRQVLAGNAAGLYGFDLDLLAPIALEHGPTVAELNTPIDAVPDHESPAFTRGA